MAFLMPSHKQATMSEHPQQSIFEQSLSDEVANDFYISLKMAESIFNFFQSSNLFLWSDIHNCEDRAEAMAILAAQWGIPHYKAWLFDRYFLKNEKGSLHNQWNYHVCLLLPVKENTIDPIEYYVVDPAHAKKIQKLQEWANQLTKEAFSSYLIKNANTYIFPAGQISKYNWHNRNKQNFKWTIQGLAGINGVSNAGKAALIFKKALIRKTLQNFTALKFNKPHFSS